MSIDEAIQELKSKNIAVLGFRVNNWHLVFWLLDKGIPLIVCDQNPAIEREVIFKTNEKEQELLKEIKEWRTGKSFLKNLDNFDLVFRTPGLPYLAPEIQKAKNAGVKISSQTELFLRLTPCKVIGVTGTKGKSTTTAMIAHLLEESKLQIKNKKFNQIYLAGNIGLDPFVFLDDLTVNDIVVLELSSFQLQGLSISPSVAVVTRVTADHLDHHENIEEYYQAKANIFNHQKKDDWLIINVDEKINQNFIKEAKSQIIRYSGENTLDRGIFIKNNEVVIRDEKGVERSAARENEGKVVGKHNLENWAAAAAVGYFVFGIGAEKCRESFKRYSPLPYRLEFLREIDGVKYYNDSYATNPASTIAAIQSFSDSPIILICGGSFKGADFSEMAREIVDNNVRAVVLIGEESKKIISNFQFPISNEFSMNQFPKIIDQNPQTMKEIVWLAKNEARKGDVVLFSPGCASFDMFKNATDRGEQFRKIVNEL